MNANGTANEIALASLWCTAENTMLKTTGMYNLALDVATLYI